MEKENITNDVISMIKDWSEVFDLPIKDTKEFPGMERVGLSMDLINEEFMETLEAIDNRDITEVQDGLGDLLWVTVRAMMEFGIDPLETIQKIYVSNMSKADTNMNDAIRTYKHYMEQGIQTYSKDKKGLFITYRTSDNKVLKSAKWIFPKF
jgi:NTP pyrophosphatase (non-canonical NTP hydrolase)